MGKARHCRPPSADARAAWDRAWQARTDNDPATVRRWLERAHRLVPNDPLVRLTLGAHLLDQGQPGPAASLLHEVALEYDAPAAWMALASCRLALDQREPALAALTAALHSSVPTPALNALADRILDRWPATIDPTPPRKLMRVSGFVTDDAAGISGWAWHPADPDRDPRLTLRGPLGAITVTATEPADGIDDLPPLARPRRFAVPASELAPLGKPVSVGDDWGHKLLGSPVCTGLTPSPPAASARPDLHPRPVDIVVPVHGSPRETLACLDSVLASVPAATVIHVVDDASPEPGLTGALHRLAAQGRIRLHRHEENHGFPAAANTGMRAAAARDVVLLNSDTLVPPGWLDRLRRAAYSAPEIGSATPLSNQATIVSYPALTGNPAPDLAGTVALDRIAHAANAGQVADIPVGVGFCLFLRRDCLDQVGPFRDDLFGQGYGEENDWCLRAAAAGWRHVAALDLFVAHLGGRSFGAGRAHLRRRNAARLNRLHPGYDAAIAAHVAADPLFVARRRMDALRWAEARQESAVLLVTHAEGGGVAELVAARAAALRDAGHRPVLLHPAPGGCAIEGFPNLRYAIPAELPALAALLRPDRPTHLEAHHLLGHHHALLDLAPLLGVPVDTWVHDAAHFCPRLNLVGRSSRYCGEPDPAECERCVAQLGSHLHEPIELRALRSRSAADLAASRRVVVATQDGATRLQRHFPGLTPEIRPWEDDSALPAPNRQASGPARIVVVGAIAGEKGYDVLLACAQDARRRRLPLEFVLCGFTTDDARLMAAGDVFVTGRYDPADAVALIRAQAADLAFVPSVCPESWCYALSRAWQAGLEAVAFDLGAQAERIRATGRGAVLPLALPVAAVNDALLRLARVQRSRQTPQP